MKETRTRITEEWGDRQTDGHRQRDRQTDRETETDRQTDRQTDRDGGQIENERRERGATSLTE